MSRYFVTDPPVPVYEFDPTAVISETPPNVIYIRAKMDVATDAKVKSELVTMGADNKTVEMRLGENQLALLIHNIVRWEGPDLSSVPCTVANIRALDPTEPHIVLVLDEIARRNKRPDSPNPKSAAGSTYAKNGAAGSLASDPPSLSHQLAIGIGKSPLRSAVISRQNKLED
jgi:hypothetical protein